MKKLAITVSLLAGATVGYSQGVLNWSDYVSPAGGLPAFSITIWSPQPNGVEQTGNSATSLPAGSTVYSGQALGAAGTGGTTPTSYGNPANYTVGLYLDTSPSGVTADVTGGTPLATANFSAGSGGWDFSGGLNAADPSSPSGTAVYAALAAWYNNSGTIGTYAASQPAGPAGYVVSTGTTTLGGGGSPPAVPGTLAGIGLTDFSLASVPEPSTIALGIIGASAFLMRLRRKQ